MLDKEQLEDFLTATISELLGEEQIVLSSETVLLGKNSVIDSILLVGLLVAVEDFCLERGIAFEWAADAAMSEKRSHYRTIGSLADYLSQLPLSPEPDN